MPDGGRTAADEERRRGGDDAATDVGSVLLLAPAMSDAPTETCRRTLTELGPDRTDVLVVSYHQTPDRWLEAWARRNAPTPARLGFVHAGGMTRSAAPSVGVDIDVTPTVQTVSNPNDLTGLGITLSKYLEGWHGDGHRPLVCFLSVTALLQYVDLETAYRFLHVLVTRTAAAGGVGVYHLDPGAHEDRTVNTLRSLFDAVETADA